MKHILLLTLAAVTLMAADATGTWVGNLTVLTPGGTEDHPAHLVLKQDGTTLTGTAGPDAGEQYPISNGKAENGNVSFEVSADNSVMKLTLKQDGDGMKGEMVRQREGETLTAKIAVKRDK